MFGSATSDDLWNEIQIALNNSGKHPDYMVKDVMHTWVKQRNYPVIEVKRNEDHEIIICLQHFNESGNNQYSMNRSWWIPVTYTVQTKHDFINTVPQTWLTPETSCVTLDPIPKRDWIIVNIQQSGKLFNPPRHSSILILYTLRRPTHSDTTYLSIYTISVFICYVILIKRHILHDNK